MASTAPNVILHFSGIYDAANNGLSGAYASRFGGYSRVWDANKTKAGRLALVPGPQLLPDEGLTFIALQVCRGGTSLLLIILGLILARYPKMRVAHAAHE